MKAGFVALAVAFAPTGAAAQVFDMGGLTGTLSQDHVTQSEERRAGVNRSAGARAASRAQARNNCTVQLPKLRKRYGASHPEILELTSLCRRIGYRP